MHCLGCVYLLFVCRTLLSARRYDALPWLCLFVVCLSYSTISSPLGCIALVVFICCLFVVLYYQLAVRIHYLVVFICCH